MSQVILPVFVLVARDFNQYDDLVLCCCFDTVSSQLTSFTSLHLKSPCPPRVPALTGLYAMWMWR